MKRRLFSFCWRRYWRKRTLLCLIRNLIGMHPSSRNSIQVGVDLGHSRTLLNNMLSTLSRSWIFFWVKLYQISKFKRILLRKREFLRRTATSKKKGPKHISSRMEIIWEMIPTPFYVRFLMFLSWQVKRLNRWYM